MICFFSERRWKLQMLRGIRQKEREVTALLRSQGYTEETIMRSRNQARHDFRKFGGLDSFPSLPLGGLISAWLVGSASGWVVIVYFKYHVGPGWGPWWSSIITFVVTFAVTFGALRWVRQGKHS